MTKEKDGNLTKSKYLPDVDLFLANIVIQVF